MKLCSSDNHYTIAWTSTNKWNFISLYRHEKHILRIICDKDRFAHRKSLFKHAKTLTVYEINLLDINRTTPFVFHNLYTLKPPIKYFLRSGDHLPVPLKRAKFSQFSIYFSGPYFWNNISAQKTFICNLEYYPLFKNRLK